MRLLTEQAELLDSFSEAVSYLAGQPTVYDEDCLARLSRLQLSLARTDPTLPPGWTSSAEGKTDSIRAPDGTVFRSRRSALEQMMVSPGKYQGEEVELMRTFLKYEDWTETPDLPTGWRMKRGKKSVLLMGNDGKRFKSLTDAAEFVNRYRRYFNQEDVQKIIKLSYSCGKTERPSQDRETTRGEKKENVANITRFSSSSSCRSMCLLLPSL